MANTGTALGGGGVSGIEGKDGIIRGGGKTKHAMAARKNCRRWRNSNRKRGKGPAPGGFYRGEAYPNASKRKITATTSMSVIFSLGEVSRNQQTEKKKGRKKVLRVNISIKEKRRT